MNKVFKCVTKELKKKIFNGLDRLEVEMEHKVQLLDVILLYAEGLDNKGLCQELGLTHPVLNRRLSTVKSILDKYTLKEVEDLHKTNLGIRPTTTLEKVLAAIETYDDLEYEFQKEELLTVLSLYCLGHNFEEIVQRLPQLDYNACQDYFYYIQKIAYQEFLEIDKLYHLNRGLREYFKDAYTCMHRQDCILVEGDKIIKKYFANYFPQESIEKVLESQQDAN